jgi:prolyl-tRNA editing enzyme YbaK/EbsC (Cys-tRNA(Pro) deacylase)
VVSSAGTLNLVPVSTRPDLLGAPVAAALSGWDRSDEVSVAEIDPGLADTAALVEAHAVPPEMSANCVVVAGRRAGDERVAACVVLATTRADVNGLVRRLLDVRKASFLAMDLAVEWTGMEYGGITPIGLPAGWSLFVDSAVNATPYVVIGSGVRRSKLALPGAALADLPNAQVIDGLGQLA